MQTTSSIRIPMINGPDFIEFFPDELPVDHNDVIDILRAELAPFKVWRSCAIEYHRQGMNVEFDSVLTEIVLALEDPSVDKIYHEREDYSEGITDIYVALAAKALSELVRLNERKASVSSEQISECTKKVVECLKRADDKFRGLNEYTWIIKGFYEIAHGDTKRAEDHFRSVYNVATKGQSAVKKKYLFCSLLGMGVVAYSNKKYQAALDHFTKAVMSNPSCGASVRLAVACCCYKLEQFERAAMAVDRAFAMEPADANILTMKALLEQTAARQKDRKGGPQRSLSLEYSRLACAVAPSSAAAINVLANHYFHNWTTVSLTPGMFSLAGGRDLLILRDAVADLRVGDRVVLGADGVHRAVLDIQGLHGAAHSLSSVGSSEVVRVRLGDLSSLAGQEAQIASLQVLELGRVLGLATEALRLSPSAAVRAESHYLIGKIKHAQGDCSAAFECYRRAFREAPDLSLAVFGAAQILLSQGKHADSLEMFEKVLTRSPDDKDTQAYVMLLRALHQGVAAPLDKLREVAPGFRLEVDLWLLQGQLREAAPADHAAALKCFLHARECIEQAGGAAPAKLLANMSVLYHSLGQVDKALDLCRQALVACALPSEASANISGDRGSIYSTADFEGVFFRWGESPVGFLRQEAPDVFALDSWAAGGDSGAGLEQLVAAGDEVLLAGVKHVVSEVAADRLTCHSPVRLVLGGEAALPLVVKRSLGTFRDETTTICYNLARMLEDTGRTKAASELYVELLKKHPSFIECYLRLSSISCGVGKFEDASVWLTRALAVNEEQPDATVCLGDLHYRGEHLSEARRCYEKVVSSNHHDARSMLSLGNFFFAQLGRGPAGGAGAAGGGGSLKESYKFYFHVLNEDATNVFAANGLGMVCAEKGETDAAREIFAKAREAHKAQSEDISINLAHVYLLQNRLVDAERLYQATYRSLSRSPSEGTAAKLTYLTECVAHAQYRHGRYEDALRSLQKALRMDPTSMTLWFNLGVVGEAGAAAVLAKKGVRPVAEVADAAQDVALAVKAFALVIDNKAAKAVGVDRKAAHDRLKSCKEKARSLDSQLVIARSEEARRLEDRARQEREHSSRQAAKAEEKERLERAAEAERREKQLLALQKEQKLQELREKWIVTEVVAASRSKQGAEGGGKRRKRDKGDGDDTSVLGEPDEEAGGLFDARVDRGAYEGEIDFGSSSEEDEAPSRAAARAGGGDAEQLGRDLFGEDSDEEAAAAPAKRKLPALEEGSDAEAAPAQRKRLKKGGAAAAEDGHSSGSEEFLEAE